jgi:uncharacterized membrane protein YkvI
MADEWKNIIRVACIYATTVIGAGFASGREILQFFSIYRSGGFYGILLAGFLFSIIGSFVLERVYGDRIRNYEEFIFPVYGWFIGWVIEIAVAVFMLCLFCIMIAGAGSVITDRFAIPYFYSVLLMGIITMVLIFTNIKGIVALSTFVTPVLIAGIILAGLYILFFSDREVFQVSAFITRLTGNWFISSILYVSYNSILAIVMMCSLLPYLKSVKTARIGGILGGGMLCLAAFVINGALFVFYPAVHEKELPVLAILKNFNPAAGNFYALILWLAMLTSAVTSGYCFAERTANSLKADKRLIALILCASGIPLSMLGFSRLIAIIYPIFGYLGLFMILVILLHGILSLRKGAPPSGRYGRK